MGLLTIIPVDLGWFHLPSAHTFAFLLKNGQPFPSIGSLSNLKYNQDGSVDLYFGPELPEGALESNYLRTVPGTGWSTLLRLYSPTESFSDQSWSPDDFEKINEQ